jgi:hypothetical protein
MRWGYQKVSENGVVGTVGNGAFTCLCIGGRPKHAPWMRQEHIPTLKPTDDICSSLPDRTR